MPHKADAILDASNPASPLSVPPSQTAVLLLDYHVFICGMIPEPAMAGALNAVSTLKTWAETNNALIIHGLLDVFGPIPPTFKGFARVQGMQSMLSSDPTKSVNVVEHPSVIASSTSEIAKAAAQEAKASLAVEKVSDREYVVRRQLGILNALKSQGLLEILREKGIKSLVIGGLSTSGCTAATARPAADEGFIVTVIRDACADPVEGVHETVLEHVLSSQAHVTGSAEWVKAWEK